MLTAQLSNSETIVAWDAVRSDGPFRCKQCGKPALLVKGDIRAHHFRHEPDHVHCDQERGETEAHRDCKVQIYNALLGTEAAESVELERRIGQNIADVFAIINGFSVAIEVQRSILSVQSIRQRTLQYHQAGVFVLWLGLYTEDVCFDGYSPKAWERWCHALYGGRTYYWVQGETLQPIHFAPHTERMPLLSRPGAAGRVYQTGGHIKFFKSMRNPAHGVRVSISEHFRPVQRAQWSAGTVDIPRCSIFVDTQRAWWK